jgi:ketosteroid isomerase-like protein
VRGRASDAIERYLSGTSGSDGNTEARNWEASVAYDIVRRLFERVDSRDWDRLSDAFCDDVVYERPGYAPLIGLESVLHFYREDRVIVSGRHELESVVINEGCGACWGRFVGTHKNGSDLSERFADVYTFERGKIKTRKSYFFRPAI